MLLVNDKQYYKINEIAKIADVNVRTLRRWLTDGNLSHFLFPFKKTATGTLYYRLEPPEEDDQLWEGESVYRIPVE